MLHELELNGIKIAKVYYCLHGKNDGCDCRKPETGLFRAAQRDFRFDPQNTFFIGDKVSDVIAGRRFGLRTLFVLTGHGSKDRTKLGSATAPAEIFPSLKEAADYVVAHLPL